MTMRRRRLRRCGVIVGLAAVAGAAGRGLTAAGVLLTAVGFVLAALAREVRRAPAVQLEDGTR